MHYFKTITILVMASFYILVGVDHFLRPEWYVRIVPPILPYKLALVYISGIFEIFFGGLLLIPNMRYIAGWGLILLLIAVFPANIFLYINQEVREAYGVISQEQALVRMFFQLPLVLIAYWHSRIKEPIWFSYLCGAVSIPTIIYFINLLF